MKKSMPDFVIEPSFDISFLSDPFIQVGFIIIALIVLAVAAVFLSRYFILGKSRVSKSFTRKIFLVTVPKETKQRQDGQPITLQQIQEKIGVAESFFSILAGLPAEKGIKSWLFGHNDIFSFEIVVLEGKTCFFIAMPLHFIDYIQEQIHAQFTQAVIEEVPDYNIFSAKGFVKGKMLKFKRREVFPIKTYK